MVSHSRCTGPPLLLDSFCDSADFKEKLNHVRINKGTEEQHNRIIVLECAMANVNYGMNRFCGTAL
jgi:hypothetical protein